MQAIDTVEVRLGSQRGAFANSWLNARFSVSFGSYQVDIFIMPLMCVVEHRDSLGNHAHVRPGQVQKMRAGSGIRHSQMNASTSDLDHHLQIWLKPRLPGGTPSVETREFDLFGRPGEWCTVISPDGRDGSFAIEQGGCMVASTPDGDARVTTPNGTLAAK